MQNQFQNQQQNIISYLDAWIEKDFVYVTEIIQNTKYETVKIKKKIYPAEYSFYYEKKGGKYVSIFGTELEKQEFSDKKSFIRERKNFFLQNKRTFEASISPIFKTLEKYYNNKNSPELRKMLFDIEVDMDPQRGYASPEDPYGKITSISFYDSKNDEIYTLAIPPKSEEKNINNLEKCFHNVYLFKNEKDLLSVFFEILEDFDVLSGWNSSGFDIPYLINRVSFLFSQEETKKFCRFGKLPKKRTYMKYGKEVITYELFGRIHLDYLDLYTKHSQTQLQSYRLDYVATHEVGEKKVPYKGSLYDLYNNEFVKFIEYNRQDVHLLRLLDKKLKYIDLSNKMAHENLVLIQNTLGSVALIDQAIVLEAHNLGMKIPDKMENPEKDYEKTEIIEFSQDNNDNEEENGDELKTFSHVVGAYVAEPKQGLQKWIGACDINSLYPSIIRSFNMSPETIVAQIRPTHTLEYIMKREQTLDNKNKNKLFDEMFGCLEYFEVLKKSNVDLIVDFESGISKKMKAFEVHNLVFSENSNLCISANGTIFTYEKTGVIPSILNRWYKERKEMQNVSKFITSAIFFGGKMPLQKEDNEWLINLLKNNQ